MAAAATELTNSRTEASFLQSNLIQGGKGINESGLRRPHSHDDEPLYNILIVEVPCLRAGELIDRIM